MARTTKQATVNGSRARSCIGLLFGTVALFWSAQLWAKDPSIDTTRRDEQEEAPQHVLVISIPDRKLAVMEEGRVLKVYPVAVGATETPSPAGAFHIVNKVVCPAYYHQGKVIPPGKSNPLGDRWMGLSLNGYGIHGTNVPSSIGRAASHGCIRMARHDVENLFALARVGDAVEIHGGRDAQTAEIFGDTGGVNGPAAPVATGTPVVAAAHAPAPSPAVIAAMAEEATNGD